MSDSRFKEAPYQEAIQNALAGVVNHDQSATQEEGFGALVVTKWVVVVEILDTNGEKFLTGYRGPTSNSIPTWDVKGLLGYAADEMDFNDKDEE